MSVKNITVYGDDISGRTTQDEGKLTGYVVTVVPAKGTAAEKKAATLVFEPDMFDATFVAFTALLSGDSNPMYQLIRPVSAVSGPRNSNGDAGKIREWARAQKNADGSARWNVGEKGVLAKEITDAYTADQATNRTVNGATGESHNGSPTPSESNAN